jgi:hypothetical protein
MGLSNLSLLIRSEVEEKNTVNITMPLEGEPILSNQGAEVKITTLHIVGEIPDFSNCESIKVYGEEFSGEVVSSITTQQFASTPYKTNILVCMGE